MINYQECFQYYTQLLEVCDEHTTHQIVQWYQEKCRIYEDEIYIYPDIIWPSRKWNKDYSDCIDLSGDE
jgi:hypothetical protein